MRFEVILSILTTVLFKGTAAADVRLTSDIVDAEILQEIHRGDILSTQLHLVQDSDAPLFGGEFSIAVASDDLQIRSVSFNPAFSGVLGEEPVLPNSSFAITRVQPLDAINRSLGSSGASVHFVTVEVEVLTDRPFESGLIVKARGALVGEIPESTTVLGNPSGPDGWGEGRIDIVNLRTEVAEVAAIPWTVEQAPASLQVRAVSGSAPVTALAPSTEYELHYTASSDAVNGFDLFVTTDAPESAAPTFDLCWEGAEVTDFPAMPATDGADAWPARRIISFDDLGAQDSPSPEAPAPGPVHLCNFVTGRAGTLTFALHLYEMDPAEGAAVHMPATAEFTVE